MRGVLGVATIDLEMETSLETASGRDGRTGRELGVLLGEGSGLRSGGWADGPVQGAAGTETAASLVEEGRVGGGVAGGMAQGAGASLTAQPRPLRPSHRLPHLLNLFHQQSDNKNNNFRILILYPSIHKDDDK